MSLVHSLGTAILEISEKQISENDVEKKSHLFGRKYGDEVLVDEPRLLFHLFGILLFLQILACLPEEDVLFAVLAPQKVAEHFPAGWNTK